MPRTHSEHPCAEGSLCWPGLGPNSHLRLAILHLPTSLRPGDLGLDEGSWEGLQLPSSYSPRSKFPACPRVGGNMFVE